MSLALLSRKAETAVPASQTKAPSNGLRIGDPDDSFEREADRVADRAMAGGAAKAEWSLSRVSLGKPLQRKCACGGSPRNSGECEGCKKEDALQRHATDLASPSVVPPIVHEVLRSPGQPLDAATRAFMEPRFGHDFSKVRVHTGGRAAESARALRALAYTVGPDIVLASGAVSADFDQRRKLLAHELTHVVQQAPNGRVASNGVIGSVPDALAHSSELQAKQAGELVSRGQPVGSSPVAVQRGYLQKAETLGTRVTQPAGATKPFKKVEGTFDGSDFAMTGDGKTLVQAGGQSGRPNTVHPADAKACKGSPGDSYLNNPRYVGIADNGPIPEGEFTFRLTDMTTFTVTEQMKMALAGEGEYVDPSGLSLHGDWGAARAPLRPSRIAPATYCGNTATRSGFYLHGGVMPGSSGCIDVGNDAIGKVVTSLRGYTAPVHLKVKYTQPAPSVGLIDRAAGRFMYPPGKNPSILDRVKSVFGSGGDD